MGRAIVNKKKVLPSAYKKGGRVKYAAGGAITVADLSPEQLEEYNALPDDAAKSAFLNKISSLPGKVAGIGQAAATAITAIDNADGKSSVGGRVASNVLSRAATGMALAGPVGAGVGAAVGGIESILSENARSRAEEEERQNKAASTVGSATSIADSSYQKGGKITMKNIYSKGGKIHLKPISKEKLRKNAKLGGYQDGGEVLAYNPTLAKNDTAFQNWYQKNTLEGKNKIPYSDKLDYDYYSFYKNKAVGDIENHFPDTFKRPTHETFSNESIYSTPENPGGSWKGETFIPAKKKDGGAVTGKGTATSDSINTNLPKGAFVVPAKNAKAAELLRKQYLGEHTKKLEKGGNIAVSLSNGEHVFMPDEVETLTAAGIDLNTLAPNAEPGNELQKGGTVVDAINASQELQAAIDKQIKEKQDELATLQKNPIADTAIERVKQDLDRLNKARATAGNHNFFTYDTKSGKFVFDKDKASGKTKDTLTQFLDSRKTAGGPKVTSTKPTVKYAATDDESSGVTGPAKTDKPAAAQKQDATLATNTVKIPTEGTPPAPDFGAASVKALPKKKPAVAVTTASKSQPVVTSPAEQTASIMPITGAPAKLPEPVVQERLSLPSDYVPGKSLETIGEPSVQIPQRIPGQADNTVAARVAAPGTAPAAAGGTGETGFTRGIGILGLGQAGMGIAQLIMDGKRPVDTVDRALQQRADEAVEEAKLGMNTAVKVAAEDAIELNRRADVNYVTNAVGTDTGSGVAAMLSAGNNANRARIQLAAEEEAVRERKNLRADALVGTIAEKKEKIFNDKMVAFMQNQQAAADLTRSGINNIIESRRLANYNKNLERIDNINSGSRITSQDVNAIKP